MVRGILMSSLEVETTSKDTSKINRIDIRQNEDYYLHLDTTIVNNTKDSEKSLKGKLIVERKGKKDEWSTERLSTSTLIKGQHTEITFQPDDLYKLHCELSKLYDSFPSRSGYFGKYVQFDGKKESIVEFLESNPLYPLIDTNHDYKEKSEIVAKLLSDPKITARQLSIMTTGSESLSSEQLGMLFDSLDEEPNLIELLKTIKTDNVATLHQKLSLAQMCQLANTIEKHLDCSDEKKWQLFFHKHQWILEQLFFVPMCYFFKEIPTGDPGANHKGGNDIDFGLLHELSSELALVEIKPPTAKLIGSSKPYRNNVYEIDTEVTNGVLQVLNGRMESIIKYGPHPDKISKHPAFQPKCILLIGRYDSLDDDDKRRSFTLYRESISGVEIITYDELLLRIKSIIKLLSGRRPLVDPKKND